MGEVSGGRLVAKALKAEGVKYIFTLNGGHIYNIFEGCADEGIDIIDVRHEQVAGHAAEGWSRVTRTPGVAVVTAGPGVTDTVTAMANAYQAPSPMICIGSNSGVKDQLMGGLQDFDSVTLMRSVSNFSERCALTNRIPDYVATAFRWSTTGRMGPSYLEFPNDVLNAKVEETKVHFPTNYRTNARIPGDPELINEAARLLKNAKRPVVMAGSDVWWTEGAATLREFIETIKAPVFLNGMGRGSISPDHPQFGAQSRRFALTQADLVLLIGVPIDFRMSFGRNTLIPDETKLVHIMSDPREIGRNRGNDVGLVGNARLIMEQILDALPGAGFEASGDWAEKVHEDEMGFRTHDLELMETNQSPIHPMRLVGEIRKFLDRDATVVGDGGDIVTFGARVIPIHEPGHWLDPGQFGCLGVGTGFAMAAQLARPGKQILLLNGDGGFGLNGMDMETMVRFKLPVVSVVANNGGWAQTIHGVKRAYGRALGCDLSQETQYGKIVEAMGGYGERVERPEDIRPALERAFASGLPACVDVVTDPEISYGTMPGRSQRRIS